MIVCLTCGNAFIHTKTLAQHPGFREAIAYCSLCHVKTRVILQEEVASDLDEFKLEAVKARVRVLINQQSEEVGCD